MLTDFFEDQAIFCPQGASRLSMLHMYIGLERTTSLILWPILS